MLLLVKIHFFEMKEDILVLLDPRKYVKLIKVLIENQSSALLAIYMIKRLIEWDKIKARKGPEWFPQISKAIQMETSVFVPRSGPLNGTFLYVTKKTNDPYCISFFSLHENKEELIKCLNETNIIDWSMNLVLKAITPSHLIILEDLVKKHNLQIEHINSFNNYRISKEKLFALPKIKYVLI